uniref:Uncharacterized protein n=1 Tax=Buteo japonicus TaxID=224669 RepID=A0A8C0BLX6_9AVES
AGPGRPLWVGRLAAEDWMVNQHVGKDNGKIVTSDDILLTWCPDCIQAAGNISRLLRTVSHVFIYSQLSKKCL